MEQLEVPKFMCLLFVLKQSHICYYIICMTIPLANSLLSEYINVTGKNIYQKLFVLKKSVNDNFEVSKICASYKRKLVKAFFVSNSFSQLSLSVA